MGNSLRCRAVVGSLFLGCALVFAGSVQAQPVAVSGGSKSVEGETTVTIDKTVVVVSGRLSLGVLNGDANELVYNPDTGAMLSKLVWDLDNVVMLGAGVSVTPREWLKLNADVWFKVNDEAGSMNDYDWFVEGWEWTHWSYHDDVELDTGFMFDINAEMNFFTYDKTTLYGIVGFKHDNWGWTARGGSFVYSTFYLRDTIGTFEPGVAGISYEQWFDAPYIGLGFQADLTPITLTGRVIGSTWVDAEDEDHHYLRNLIFTEEFDSGSMIGVDLAGTYRFSGQLAMTAMFHYQKYYDLEGTTTILDQTTGKLYFIDGDAAGTDHTSSLFSLSLSYDF